MYCGELEGDGGRESKREAGGGWGFVRGGVERGKRRQNRRACECVREINRDRANRRSGRV